MIEPVPPAIRRNGKAVSVPEEKIDPIWRPALVYDSDAEISPVTMQAQTETPSFGSKQKLEAVSDEGRAEAPKELAPEPEEQQSSEPVYTGPERRDGLDRRAYR